MNENIASILKDRIKDLPFIDKIAGLVRPVRVEVLDDKNAKQLKTYPIASDIDVNAITQDKYRSLVPNSKFKSIIYFEDSGTTLAYRDRDRVGFVGRVILVGWLNLPKLLDCEFKTGSTQAILSIISKLPGDHFSDGVYREMRITAVNEIPKSNAIFSRYTYDEIKNQYLMYPFDYFALNIQVEYWINIKCIDDFNLGLCNQCS